MAIATTRNWRENRWRPRPVVSWSIRIAVFIVPVAVGFATSLLISRALPRPRDVTTEVMWWALLVASVLTVVFVATAACRRFLPLAALLDLSLLFPDKAPSRFALARLTGGSKQLAEQLQALRDDEDIAASAQVRHAEQILSLVASLSVHDARTRGHSERVRVYTDMLSEQLGLPEEDRDRLRWASMLHDIGKLIVPTELLNKPGELDEHEWETVHRHPIEGARILAPLRPWLGEWTDAAEHHHEWWDGTGYPRGLKHEEISRAGRIVAVADAYETMTSARRYQKTLTPVAAKRELVASSGTQFDPRIVRAFLEISVGRLWRAVGLEALIAEIPLLAPVVWLTGRAAGWSAPAAATAGTLAVLVASGVLAPAATTLQIPGSPRQATRLAGSPTTGGSSATGAGAGPAATSTASAPGQSAVTTSVEGASTTTPNTVAPSLSSGGAAGTTATTGTAPTSTHGASAFTPGHGYGPPPGLGGAPPGRIAT
jgi:HD domain-containing protein